MEMQLDPYVTLISTFTIIVETIKRQPVRLTDLDHLLMPPSFDVSGDFQRKFVLQLSVLICLNFPSYDELVAFEEKICQNPKLKILRKILPLKRR